MDPNQFKHISTCESAKEVWEILFTVCERTSTLRLSRLQILTTKFENLKMHEDKTIGEFNAQLCDIANEMFMLGEKMFEEKLVRKTLDYCRRDSHTRRWP